MVNELLKKLGFSDKEIEVYLTILKNGKVTFSNVSRITGIKRTTVYSIAGELVNKGVVDQDFSSPTKYLVARPPEELNVLVKKEQEKLEKKKGIISSVVDELKKTSSNSKYSVPKIRFIGEEDLKDFLIRRIPIWDNSMLETEPCMYGFQDHTYAENYPGVIDWYWSRADKRIDLKLLTNKAKIEDIMSEKKYERRNMKFLKKKGLFTATTWIMGDYMVMVVTNEKPNYAIEIRNSVLAQNQRDFFKVLWNMID